MTDRTKRGVRVNSARAQFWMEGLHTTMTLGNDAGLEPAQEREQRLYKKLAELGIAWTTHAHVPVFTVEDARAARVDALAGTHTKNLFLENKNGELFLVAAREELRLDLNALAKLIGSPRFSFGKPERLIEVIGIAPGSVSPFALINDGASRVRAFLDEGMLGSEPLNFHPLRNDRTTAIGAPDLLRFLRAINHEPLVLRLPEKANSA